MEKITIKDFKENTFLIIVTVLLAFLMMWISTQEPVYSKPGEGFVLSLIVFIICTPIVALYNQKIWNNILRKIFPLKEISYGVGFLISLLQFVLFGV